VDKAVTDAIASGALKGDRTDFRANPLSDKKVRLTLGGSAPAAEPATAAPGAWPRPATAAAAPAPAAAQAPAPAAAAPVQVQKVKSQADVDAAIAAAQKAIASGKDPVAVKARLAAMGIQLQGQK
jgi:hypothetical protein